MRAARLLGYDWPSNFRNLLNYRPGYGYGSVRQATPVTPLKRHDEPFTFDALLKSFETDVASLDGAVALDRQAACVARGLVGFTFIVNAIARSLHDEVSIALALTSDGSAVATGFWLTWSSLSGRVLAVLINVRFERLENLIDR